MKEILSKETIWDEQSRLIPEDDESDGQEIAESVAGKRIMYEQDFYDALDMLLQQQQQPAGLRWVKASEKLPEGINGYAKDIVYKVHRDSGIRLMTSTVNQFLDTVKYRIQEKYEWLEEI